MKDNLVKSNITPIVMGDGDKIVDQFPRKGSVLNQGNKLFLYTNSNEFKMINIKGWSRSEVNTYASFLGIDVIFTGNGYVTDFNIKVGDEITDKTILDVKLETKFTDEENEDDKNKK